MHCLKSLRPSCYPMYHLRIMGMRCAALLLFAGMQVFAADPTPQEIIDCWAEMSGNKGGKVVFYRKESGQQRIFVMDLKIGLAEEIATHSLGCIKWSPDGKRIATQNRNGVDVMNADGSNMKTIWSGNCGGDQYACNWQDNNHVVYSRNTKISSTEVLADNSPGETVDIFTRTPDGPYNCVQISGDYVGFNEYEANLPTGGLHRPAVANWKTGAMKELVGRDEDGCTVRMKPGGSGTCIFNKWNHHDPALIMTHDGVLIDSMPGVDEHQIGFMEWSNDSNFMIHADVDLNDHMTWIRDCNNKDYCFLGSDIGWRDLWVDNTMGITIEEPNAQTVRELGDTLYLRWTYTGGPNRPVVFSLSVDNGQNYAYPLFDRPYIHKSEQGDTFWIIPEDSKYVTAQAKVRMYDYSTGINVSANSEAFTINRGPAVIGTSMYWGTGAGHIRIFKEKILYEYSGNEKAALQISLLTLNGRCVATKALARGITTLVLPPSAGRGIYVLAVYDNSGVVEQRFISIIK